MGNVEINMIKIRVTKCIDNIFAELDPSVNKSINN